jgi:hypothetical protein
VGGVVEDLERRDERCERVGAKEPDRWRCDAGHPLLAGVGVAVPRAPQREAVDRPVPRRVGAVAAAQQRAELGDLLGVLGARCLGAEQPAGAVAQLEQGSQLVAL